MTLTAHYQDSRPSRTLIKASAGSGKTTRLANHILSLLLRGEKPSYILATTFTRKAAGEIFSRVITRLAHAHSSAEFRELLARQLEMPFISQPQCSLALRALVDEQHLMRIDTIDKWAFTLFKTFSLELGVSTSMKPASSQQEKLLLQSACLQLISDLGNDELSILFNALECEAPRRSVLDRLVHFLEGLIASFDKGGCTSIFQSLDVSSSLHYSDNDLIALCQNIPLPLTKTGSPRAHWKNAIASIVDSITNKNWDQSCEKGLLGALLKEETTFDKVEFPPELNELFPHIIACGRQTLLPKFAQQATTFQVLSTALSSYFYASQINQGLVTFDSVKTALGLHFSASLYDEISFRLGTSISHLLLDEFQDTSVKDWCIFSPLVHDILSDIATSHSFLCVGDEKQSIYRFRGGSAELFKKLESNYDSDLLSRETLSHCYRCAPEILSFVNKFFFDLPENIGNSSSEYKTYKAFSSSFECHTSPRVEGGFVEFCYDSEKVDSDKIDSDKEEGEEASTNVNHLNSIAAKVKEFLDRVPDASIAILVRSNKQAHLCATTLRTHGLVPSVETVFTLGQDLTVATILSFLTFCEHPGDSDALLFAYLSPLHRLLKTSPLDSSFFRDRQARRLREEIYFEGLSSFVLTALTLLLESGAPYTSTYSQHLFSLTDEFDQDPEGRLGPLIAEISCSKAERVTISTVRILTLHGAKGLEFDLVILPFLNTLELPPRPRYSSFLVDTDLNDSFEEIAQLSPWIPKKAQLFIPEFSSFLEKVKHKSLVDELCLLYVGLTRARHGLILMSSPPSNKKSISAADLLFTTWKQQLNDSEDGLSLFEAKKDETLTLLSRATKTKQKAQEIPVVEKPSLETLQTVSASPVITHLDECLIDSKSSLSQRLTYRRLLSSLGPKLPRCTTSLSLVEAFSHINDPETQGVLTAYFSTSTSLTTSFQSLLCFTKGKVTYKGSLLMVAIDHFSKSLAAIDVALSDNNELSLALRNRKTLILEQLRRRYPDIPLLEYFLFRH